MFYVYGSFLLIGLLGLWLRSHYSWKNLLASSLFASFLFFILTNFGVWSSPTSWYPHNLTGLMECYLAAIPFYRNTFLGDFFYTGVFFGGYELALRIKSILKSRTASTT